MSLEIDYFHKIRADYSRHIQRIIITTRPTLTMANFNQNQSYLFPANLSLKFIILEYNDPCSFAFCSANMVCASKNENKAECVPISIPRPGCAAILCPEGTACHPVNGQGKVACFRTS